jgi:hypothetical protein
MLPNSGVAVTHLMCVTNSTKAYEMLIVANVYCGMVVFMWYVMNDGNK